MAHRSAAHRPLYAESASSLPHGGPDAEHRGERAERRCPRRPVAPRRLSQRVHRGLWVADAAQVGSQEPLDGSLDCLLDTRVDRRDGIRRRSRLNPLLGVHHPRYARSSDQKREGLRSNIRTGTPAWVREGRSRVRQVPRSVRPSDQGLRTFGPSSRTSVKRVRNPEALPETRAHGCHAA